MPTLACAQSSAGPARERSARADARLVVLITVDQLRADYLERFGPQLRGGLARLTRGGAWFTNAHQDHAITETAPGHASLLSGRFPRSTGIMMNAIGVDDPDAPLLDGAIGPGASPKRFRGTTLVDWLRAGDPRSRTFSVSMKDRGAILPVGRSRSEVYWYSPDGRFTTSRWYRDSLPAWVDAFNERRVPFSYAGRSWTLLLPDSAYRERDSVAAEWRGGRDAVFPHPLPDDDADAASAVRGSPFIDEIVLAFALHGVKSLSLGAGAPTDVLAVSLSATDLIGHAFGPDSREIHDQILRLDRALGVFLDSLYRLRDSSRVIIALSADHGVGTIPELAPASVTPRPVRVSLGGVVHSVRAGLFARHVDTMALALDQEIVFLNRAALREAKVDADSVLAAFAASARRVPGVLRVDRFPDLVADSARDLIARRWAHQFPPDAHVDQVITLTPFSTWGGNVASHGSPHDYDSHVPLIVYGAGVRPGRHPEFVRTVDLAPTLAAALGVGAMERLDGVVLWGALPLRR